jgi:hypothetical protein
MMELQPGDTLILVDAAHREVRVRRRGATAPGRFRVRKCGQTLFVTFEIMTRRSRSPRSTYVGVIEHFNYRASQRT